MWYVLLAPPGKPQSFRCPHVHLMTRGTDHIQKQPQHQRSSAFRTDSSSTRANIPQAVQQPSPRPATAFGTQRGAEERIVRQHSESVYVPTFHARALRPQAPGERLLLRRSFRGLAETQSIWQTTVGHSDPAKHRARLHRHTPEHVQHVPTHACIRCCAATCSRTSSPHSRAVCSPPTSYYHQ